MGIYQNQRSTYLNNLGGRNRLAIAWGDAFPEWFQAIPPERVGLNGEYDHFGLQKRVQRALQRNFHPHVLSQLSVSQRGRVVILQGTVSDRALLQQLVEVAQRVEGTIRVEAHWVACESEAVALATA